MYHERVRVARCPSAAGLNPYRSAGGLYDRTTNWIKYGQRWYNPTTGRFTQQDSIERLTDPEQGNRYAYAADNPINYTDPTGRWPDIPLPSLDQVISATVGIVVTVAVFAGCTLATDAIGAVIGLCAGAAVVVGGAAAFGAYQLLT